MMQRLLLVGVTVLILLSLTGCGGPDNIGRVSGKVTLDGQPLAGAIVRFKPKAGGSPSTAITDSTGNYVLGYTRKVKGAEIGEHSVSISTFVAGDPDAEPPKLLVPEKVPTKYNAKSEFTASVQAGANNFDFPLESAGEIVQPKDE